MLQDIDDLNWMLKPELDPAFQTLLRENLSFDALVKPEHLDNLHTLMLRYPSLRVVIDHGAKPAIAAGEFARWADNISRIAKDTNAYCKLSGLLTEAGHKASRAEIQPYMQHLLDCFGPQRLMWGSDWPVLILPPATLTGSRWYKLLLPRCPLTIGPRSWHKCPALLSAARAPLFHLAAPRRGQLLSCLNTTNRLHS